MAIDQRTRRGMDVNFFIIGVQKGGTTALYKYLRRHPQLCMADRKETHFFDNKSIDWDSPDYSLLHKEFKESSEKDVLRGEATPIYVYWPNSLSRLKEYNPAARLILILRHPVYRAHSQWRMEFARNLDHLSFAEAISEAGRERVMRAANGVHRVYSYVERGFYASQIERLFKLFPENQVLILRTDDLWFDSAAALGAVQRFLNVDPLIVAKHQYIVPIETRGIGELHDEHRIRLLEIYADDIARLKHLTGVNCDDWLDPEYIEWSSSGGRSTR